MGTDGIELANTKEPAGLVDQAADAVGTFARSLAYSAIQVPCDGVRQLVNKVAPVLPEGQFIQAPQEATTSVGWHAQVLGSAVGTTITYLGLGKVLSRTAGRTQLAGFMSHYAPGERTALLRAASTGLVMDGVFKPVDENSDSFLLDRARNATIGLATFGAMSGANSMLTRATAAETAQIAVTRGLTDRVMTNATAGAFSGLVGANAESLLYGGRLASISQMQESAYTYAFVGGALGAHQRHVDNRSRQLDTYVRLVYPHETQPIGNIYFRRLAEQVKGLKPADYETKLQGARRDILDPEVNLGFWNAQERALVVKKLQADVPIPWVTEKNLETYVRGLSRATDSWRSADYSQEGTRLVQAQDRVNEGARALSDAISRDPQLRGQNMQQVLSDPRNYSHNNEIVNAYVAQVQAVRMLRQVSEPLAPVLQARKTDLENAINEFGAQHGMPSVRVEVVNGLGLARAVMNDGNATLMVPAEQLLKPGITAKFVGDTFHEFVHLEQLYLGVRTRADRIGVGVEPTTGQIERIQSSFGLTVGKSVEADAIARLLAPRNGQMLTPEDYRRNRSLERAHNMLMRPPGKVELMERTKDLTAVWKAHNEISQPGGTYDLALRMSSTPSLLTSIFGRQGPPEEVSSLMSQASVIRLSESRRASETHGGSGPRTGSEQRGAFVPHTATEPGRAVLQWEDGGARSTMSTALQSRADVINEGRRPYVFRYMRALFEREAFSAGNLAYIKARALGMPEEPVVQRTGR